jgi:pimeloyl-ACP methyl ester carboxylesterase
MATYLLVHGAWHGGWCWKKIAPLLRAHGHDVFTPTLTGLGERAHLAHPLVGLETHLRDIVHVLTYEDLREVILVGHSNGGTLITAVAERAPERLGHLVYLDAFVPEDGQATIDLIPPPQRAEWEARVQTEGYGWLPPSLRPEPWEAFLRDFWQVTDTADRQWAVERLVPTPYQVFTDPVQRGNPAAAALPRTDIECLGNPVRAFARFAAVARSTPGWRYRELATAHESFVTAPEELAGLLLEVA